MEINYMKVIENTLLYEIMLGSEAIVQITTSSKPVFTGAQREKIKDIADEAKRQWFLQAYFVLKDLAHWDRYNAAHPDQPLDIFDYVQYKYSNTDLSTY